MRILICDDEPLAIERLSRLVVQLGHEVVAHACNGRDAIELVDQHQPDVVLLDIQMPEMNGLLCAEQLGTFDPMPAIIFCTAYDDHALDAFKSKAQGYLLKPIAQDDLARVLHQLPRLNQAQITHIKQQDTHDRPHQRQHITARTYRGVELIPVENIYYFLADQKYVTVRHKHGSVLIDETLKDLELEFQDRFIRIHRNALVSMDYLDGLELISSGQYQVRCKEVDERLAVSRRHLPYLRDRMQKL